MGAGLIGASMGIGLSAEGWDVTIEDASEEAARLARGIGAGGALKLGTEPDVVVVAVPPSAASDEVLKALKAWPSAVVTDVASVKAPLARAVEGSEAASRYVGSHPMAGREVSGGLAAQGDLFKARPWAICPNAASPEAVAQVRAIAEALGADVVTMDADAHDAAVARVSHAPQAVASAVAAALDGLDAADVALAGQGLRDVTRIAASAPEMWADIARLNSAPIRATIARIVDDLVALRDAEDLGVAMASLVARGQREVARIPGKHGTKQRDWAAVTVIVPDRPGELLRLLSDVAALGVNVEDLVIEHSPRQPAGLVTLSVDPARREDLSAALTERAWEVAAS